MFCKRCGSQIPSDDINRGSMVARCRECRAVLTCTLSDEDTYDISRKERLPVPIPDNMTIEQQGRDLKLTWKWYNWSYIILLIFCIFWDGFLAVWYTMTIGMFLVVLLNGDISSSLGVLIPCGIPILHLIAGIFITYSTIAGFVNKTRIQVNESELSIKHGPLPWYGNKNISSQELTQIFCEEHYHRSRNGSYTSYSVNAIKKDGRKLKLMSGFREAGQALFIEEKIENHLDIQDRPVPGELRK